ncbi:MAG: fumarylacetoacetate hydrolase family protein [Acidobacteriota bacterium]
MAHSGPVATDQRKGVWQPFDETTRPRRVWAMGLTFADHVRETGERAGSPVVFAKPCEPSVNPPTLPWPRAAALAELLNELDPALCQRLGPRVARMPVLLDYEVEVGLCLLEDWPAGAQHRMPRVGFFVANDATARSLQMAGMGAPAPLPFWSAAKGLAGFLPVTPATWCPDAPSADEWPDVTLRTWVNGQLRQQAPLRALLYSPLHLLQCAAAQAPDRALHRDDLVLTGTPAGIALQVPGWKRRVAACLPRPVAVAAAWRSQEASSRFLQAGDVVAQGADWLGQLQFTVEAAA